MTSIYETFQKRTSFNIPSMKNHSLPTSHSPTTTTTKPVSHLRRRLSSLSLNLHPSPDRITSTTSWVFRRSKSVSSMGESAGSSIKEWWNWGVGWILSKKPTFAKDLEMNEHESSLLGSNAKGTWRHVFYKVRSEFRKLVGGDNNLVLPQTFRYDSVAYSKNFDNGRNKMQD
ncbi:hypothetical protein RHSIM_Rhsim05G0044800 [Rhododendron simsii]|uniref:Uncharacterized protein n=1 Tax=Rhododendron simsii TaxID=118357 RepID=A0A834LMX2_RHOSS|nr:hypothetical protein RHSIM_Rhsim05G0044800 [Rhododendron simsii]